MFLEPEKNYFYLKIKRGRGYIMKKALITGITGQDGSYLAEFLLSKGYEVHGMIRRASTFNTSRIDHIYKDPHIRGVRLHLHYGDLSDSGQLTNLIYNIKPDEIYHLGAQSHVRVSFDIPEYTGDITGLGTTRILEAVRRSGIKTKYYQASRIPLLEREALMRQLKSMPTGWSVIIRRDIIYLLVMGYFSTMNRRGGGRPLSPERLPGV